MSYWTPYYSGDWPYRENLPGLRIGRFPVSSNSELLVMISKTIYYSDTSSSSAWMNNVSLWGQCHDWDGNVGETIEVLLEDLSGRIPPGFNQYKLYDKTWFSAERESLAVADWNSGRGIIHMRGTSSTFYKPVHFFSKSMGWHIGRLDANSRFPLVIGTSCGVGTYDMAQDPVYGEHFAVEILAADPQRGAIAIFGPTRGTETEGNRRMADTLNRNLCVDPVADIGTAFYNAQSEVMAAGEWKVAGSFNLLGDPMAPVPGQAVASAATHTSPRQRTALLQNYPNPFNPTTTIRYYLSQRSRVTVRVYNVAGQLIHTLVDDVRPAGYHARTWSPSGLASGIYFLRLKTANTSDVKKMVLLR